MLSLWVYVTFDPQQSAAQKGVLNICFRATTTRELLWRAVFGSQSPPQRSLVLPSAPGAPPVSLVSTLTAPLSTSQSLFCRCHGLFETCFSAHDAAPGPEKGPTCNGAVSATGIGNVDEASLEEPQSRPPVYLSARPIIPKASVQPENTWRRGKAPSVLNWPGARGLVLEFVGIPSTRGLTPSIPQWFSNQTQLRAWEADNDSEARLWDSPLASTLNQSPACLLPPATMRPWWP